jgi:ParB-like chromosome segregation protein Spo0J
MKVGVNMEEYRMKKPKTKSIVKFGPKGHERRKPKAAAGSERRRIAKHAAARNQATPPSHKVRNIAIAQIKVRKGRRALNPKKVERLVQSIRTLGFRSALTVRPLKSGPELVAGLHRLEAAKILKMKTVPCEEIRGGKVLARMWQIGENLFRAGLTALEEAEQTAEWVKLSERIAHPSREKAKKGPGRSEGGKAKAARDLPIPGKTDEAKRKTVERRLAIADIDTAAKEAVREAGLDDSPTKLLKIAAERTAEAQLAKVKALAKGAGKTGDDDADHDADDADDAEPPLVVLKRAWKKAKDLQAAWQKASLDDRRAFIAEDLGYPLDGEPEADDDDDDDGEDDEADD